MAAMARLKVKHQVIRKWTEKCSAIVDIVIGGSNGID